MNIAESSYQKNPNPQGKGTVAVLRDWEERQPMVLGAKSSAEFLRDYCVSSMVLAARFSFKPVPGQTYYLYVTDDGWSLSLIGPHEWGRAKADCFLGSCRLRRDMTWELDTATVSAQSTAVASARKFIVGFVDALKEQGEITSHLPFYVAELPYYQRMLATALSSSLQQSLPSGRGSTSELLTSEGGLAILIGVPST